MNIETHAKETNAHDFVFNTIEGDPLPLSSFAGKAVLIVNTASKCGFTGQYKAMQTLYETYKDQGLVVLGIPSNDFGGQEPGTSEQIKEFCEVNYDITFPLADKTVVKGPDAHPFYKWAKTEMGGLAVPRWNFHKYLVDPNGKLVDWFATSTNPNSRKVLKKIEAVLK